MAEGQGSTTAAGAGDGGQAGTDKTFTQAEVDRIVGERLQREREKYADYDELRQKAGRVDQLEQDLTTANGRVGELEPQVARLSVAMAKGLPGELADRLRGTTEDELNEDADRLLALIPPSGSGDPAPKMPAPDPSQGGNGGAPALNSDQLLETVKTKLGID